MPRISTFYGIVILMYTNEGKHAQSHFHAEYGEFIASIAFDGTVLAGALPARQLRLVRQWAEQHGSDLDDNWQRARNGERVCNIDPLA